MQIASIFTLIIGIQLFVTHVIATELYLYWSVWWMDIVMHLLGGIWLACAWRSLIDFEYLSEKWWSVKFMVPILFFLMILWEVFGIYVEQGFKAGYVTDTVGDLLCGIVGAVVGYYLLRRLQMLNK